MKLKEEEEKKKNRQIRCRSLLQGLCNPQTKRPAYQSKTSNYDCTSDHTHS